MTGREACGQLIEEMKSGVKARKRLDALLLRLVEADELVITEMDRPGRGTADLILLMDELTRRGVFPCVLAMPSLDIRSHDSRLIADIKTLRKTLARAAAAE